MEMISSKGMFPECLMFFSFFRSRGGSVAVKDECGKEGEGGRGGEGRTFERTDDEGRSGGNDGYGCLTILDRQLDSNAEALPVASRLCDIFSDFLG